ncbi:MAG: hypothetical protein HN849_20375 [Victivallales bacterium]|nr:hypothetical protein [Victivallales bacterium]
MKKTLRISLFVVALVASFSAGLWWSFMQDFVHGLGGPHIYSDWQVRESIESRLVELPEAAHHLYYGIKGFQDAEDFIAFSVPDAEFPDVLEKLRERAGSHAQGKNPSRMDPRGRGPDSWDAKFQDAAWDLKEHDDLVTDTTGRMTVMYSPSAHRFFVFLWAL